MGMKSKVRDATSRDKWRTAAALLSVLLLGLIVILVADRVNQNSKISKQASDATKQIQAERTRSILDNCIETNERNVNTKRIIKKKFSAGPVKEVSLLLVDAVAPYTDDCQALVDSKVKPAKRP